MSAVPSPLPSISGREAPTVVSLRGEYDIATVAALTTSLDHAIHIGASDVVLDLSSVEFMDAATIGVVVRAGASLDAMSRSLRVRNPSACAHRLLGLCDLLGLVEEAAAGDGQAAELDRPVEHGAA